jgi:hypothetical protein
MQLLQYIDTGAPFIPGLAYLLRFAFNQFSRLLMEK